MPSDNMIYDICYIIIYAKSLYMPSHKNRYDICYMFSRYIQLVNYKGEFHQHRLTEINAIDSLDTPFLLLF